MVSKEKPRAIVLAAGKGERMKSERPKVLLPVLGRPVLSYVLESAWDAGIGEIVLVVGHRADEVRREIGERCRYVVQEGRKGTGDAVARCRDAFRGFEGDVLVLCGDAPLVSSAAMRGMLALRERTGAACVLFTACLEDPRGYGRVIRDKETGRFVKMAEEADATDQERYVFESNSGAYCFRAPDLFEALAKVKPDNRKGEYYLTEVPRVLGEGGKLVETLRAQDPAEIFGINTRRDLVAVTNFLRWKILERHMDAGVTVVDPSTTLIESGVEIGADTIIEPFTILRQGTKVGLGCHVGPFSHLRGGVSLEDGAEIGNFVEVKNSRVGRGSKAKHLAYLGDAELGAGVNIGAGTITANYDGRTKHRTVLEDGVQTGSNTVLVAPLTMGRGARTGAGAVVPRGRVEAGTLVVGVPARALERKKRT